ncbi:EAL domain-containing protein [Sporosarcina sp. FSL K6-2383]|uniref:putative bifunctional diguanylate cyclase/phosphodiesterase n=1 Tax=Sporosarcina sp. FSL K6-2383 TaxID=2921556 RepID=UPI00315A6D27
MNHSKVLETDLLKAIERNELFLHFQPKVNLKTEKVVGVEALIRWQHPEIGLIAPGDFIPIAEEIGEITRIGKWVLYNACKQNKKWQDDGFSPIIMSVNLSPCQLLEQDLFKTVSQVLKETGLSPCYLELEITEGITIDIPKAISMMKQLRELGILISLDDFGTGYNTLTYLKEFPVDIIKIDRSFVNDLVHSSKDREIVKMIITLAHSLNIRVIAEGIETEEHLQFLKLHHCNEGQGYLFSKPVTGENLIIKFRLTEKMEKSHA